MLDLGYLGRRAIGSLGVHLLAALVEQIAPPVGRFRPVTGALPVAGSERKGIGLLKTLNPALAMLPRLHRSDAGISRNAKRRKMSADRVGDVRRRQMRVVLFGHPRIGMTKLLGDDAHRHASHGERRPISVAEHMERNRRFDPRSSHASLIG